MKESKAFDWVSKRPAVDAVVRTTAIMAVTTLLAFVVRPARGEVSGALVFVTGISLAGALSGISAGLTAASCGFLLYNFYFAEPILTFRVSTFDDFAPLIVFNACAFISGLLSGNLRDERLSTLRANRDLAALLSLSRALQSTLTITDITEALNQHTSSLPSFQIRVMDRPTIVNWLNDHSRKGSNGLSEQLPDTGKKGTRSITLSDNSIVIRIDDSESADRFVLLTIGEDYEGSSDTVMASANIVLLSLERAGLLRNAADASARSRMADLQSSLLSSLSHDFRTPITTIKASASSLVGYGSQMDHKTNVGILLSIVEEAERLDRFTGNLLELTRLDGGEISSLGRTVSVNDIIASSLHHIRKRSGSRVIIPRFEFHDLSVFAEPILFDLAISNILENSVYYSPSTARIEVQVNKDKEDCVISISDNGYGIPAGEIEKVFDRFYRVNHVNAPRKGSGLGLAIAKAFVEAFNGSIEIGVPGIDGLGVKVIIRLPVAVQEQLLNV